ncbi:MAG: TRAP transporter large permease subunit [Burkholderiaceae bacterium]|nr:TRAP transporter large permease subunit [Burkholderiaceae bacterium]
MDLAELLGVAMLLATFAILMLGYGVAFTLASVSLAFAALGGALGVFELRLLAALPERLFAIMRNDVLVAVPLFIFMGTVLDRSGIAEALLESAGELFSRVSGGLAIAVVLVGAVLGASTGIVGAAVVTMGLITLPVMLRAGYDPRLASGTVCSAATLSQILPPATVLIFLGDMLQTANSQAQMSKGNMAPEPVSVGDLFFGAVAPGLLLTAAYIGWIVLLASLRPSACPARRPTSRSSESPGRVLGRLAAALLPALILIVLVLGSILAGIATATESAAMGAVGALGLAVGRGRLSRRLLREVVFISARLSSMAFLLLFGASVLMLVFRGLGGDTMISGALEALPGGLHAAMFAVMAVTFLLGFFLDPFEIIFIVIPVAGPALIGLGADPVWLGVLFAITLQTSFLTPPFGFALFYLRSVAPATLTTGQIYRGVVPFVAIQLLVLAVVWMYEPLATTLPRWIFR